MPELVTSSSILIAVAVAAYLLGSVSFGVLLSRAFGLGDLRKIGSGNIGATNVLRTGNRKAALLTLILDGGKGAVAVALARALFHAEDVAQLAGAAAFIGHLFPIWLGFRGGKGVATFLGTLLVVAWPIGLACCATWLAVAAASRYSSSAALLASALAPAFSVIFGRGDTLFLTSFFFVLIWLRHRENIARLKAGTETKIGQKGKPADGSAEG